MLLSGKLAWRFPGMAYCPEAFPVFYGGISVRWKSRGPRKADDFGSCKTVKYRAIRLIQYLRRRPRKERGFAFPRMALQINLSAIRIYHNIERCSVESVSEMQFVDVDSRLVSKRY